MTHRTPTTDVELRLSWPSGGSFHRPTAWLEITDARARLTLAKIELDPDQFASLLSGRGAESTANLLPRHHYSKVGKWWDVLVWSRADMVREAPEEFLHYRDPDKFKPGHPRAVPSAAMTAWADTRAAELGYTGHSWSEHNWGWGIRFERYLDQDPRA